MGFGDVHGASLPSLRNGRAAVACAGLACAGLAAAAPLVLAPLHLGSTSTGGAGVRAAPAATLSERRPAGPAAGGLLGVQAGARAPISAALGKSDRAYWVGA